MRLLHTMLRVNDLQESINFYKTFWNGFYFVLFRYNQPFVIFVKYFGEKRIPLVLETPDNIKGREQDRKLILDWFFE